MRPIQKTSHCNECDAPLVSRGAGRAQALPPATELDLLVTGDSRELERRAGREADPGHEADA